MSLIQVDLTREDWQDPNNPVESSRQFSSSRLKYINFHYEGVSRIWSGSFESWLRYIQSLKSYSFMYSYAIDNRDGRIAEGRGTTFRAASNGDDENLDDDEPGNSGYWDNDEVISIIILNPGNQLSQACINSMVNLCKQLKAAYPERGLEINGHQDLDITGCPGPVIMANLPKVRELVGNDNSPPVGGSGVFLADMELLGSRSYRLQTAPFIIQKAMTEIDAPEGVDAVLANLTVVGISEAGWISPWNGGGQTSALNWDAGDRVSHACVPIVTTDGKITIFAEPNYRCELYIDIVGVVERD